MTLFKILWGLDALACLVVLYFFFIGIADGSVSGKNIGLWLGILFALGIVMSGSILLKSHFPFIAKVLLAVIAIPAVCYLLFILIAVLGKGKWN